MGGAKQLWMVCRWEFKAQHFDSVMLFKMGKFYEMFEMDAHVGAEVLGLTYMKVGSASVLWATCQTGSSKACTPTLNQILKQKTWHLRPLFGHLQLGL